MTRAELIHQMALMTDAELEQCVLIYKDGGKPKSDPIILTGEGRFPTYESLQEFIGDHNEDYDLQAFYNDKEALNDWWERHRTDENAHMDGQYKLPSHITYDNGNWKEETDGWHYYVPSDHMAGGLYYRDYDTYVDYWNRNEPESTLHYGDRTYKVNKHEKGGTLENVNLDLLAQELNKEEEETYKLIKLCKEGSILDLLKELLPDNEIFDLISKFGIDDLLTGGIKKGTSVSIQIIMSDGDEEKTDKTPKLQEIEIGDKTYKVEVVSTEEDMEKGLGERKSLDKDKGMLFDFKGVQEEVTFNCEEMLFPIDIIFINNDDEVIRVAENCLPGKDLFTENNVRYVLEVNVKSGIKQGNDFDISPNSKLPVMKVLAPDGSTLMELLGGERIFSRIKTKLLIKWAKKADKSKNDSDYKRLGNIIFKELYAQDHREAEYVELPDNE